MKLSHWQPISSFSITLLLLIAYKSTNCTRDGSVEAMQSSFGVLVQIWKISDTMPNLLVVLKCCLLIPVTSVQCESSFSMRNCIKYMFSTCSKKQIQ